MKFIFVILLFVSLADADEIKDCTEFYKRDRFECKVAFQLTPDASNQNSKIDACVNYRQIDNGTDLPSYYISGSVSTSEGQTCYIERKSTGCGDANNAIRTECGMYSVETWVEPVTVINPLQGYQMILHVNSNEAQKVCKLDFIEAQTVEQPKPHKQKTTSKMK